MLLQPLPTLSLPVQAPPSADNAPDTPFEAVGDAFDEIYKLEEEVNRDIEQQQQQEQEQHELEQQQEQERETEQDEEDEQDDLGDSDLDDDFDALKDGDLQESTEEVKSSRPFGMALLNLAAAQGGDKPAAAKTKTSQQTKGKKATKATKAKEKAARRQSKRASGVTPISSAAAVPRSARSQTLCLKQGLPGLPKSSPAPTGLQSSSLHNRSAVSTTGISNLKSLGDLPSARRTTVSALDLGSSRSSSAASNKENALESGPLSSRRTTLQPLNPPFRCGKTVVTDKPAVLTKPSGAPTSRRSNTFAAAPNGSITDRRSSTASYKRHSTAMQPSEQAQKDTEEEDESATKKLRLSVEPEVNRKNQVFSPVPESSPSQEMATPASAHLTAQSAAALAASARRLSFVGSPAASPSSSFSVTALSSQVGVLYMEKSVLENSVKSLQEEVTSLKAALAESKGGNTSSSSNDSVDLSSQVAALQRELDTVQRSHRQELMSYHERLELIENELRPLQESNMELKMENKRLEDEIKRKRTAIKGLTDQTDEQQLLIMKMKREAAERTENGNSSSNSSSSSSSRAPRRSLPALVEESEWTDGQSMEFTAPSMVTTRRESFKLAGATNKPLR